MQDQMCDSDSSLVHTTNSTWGPFAALFGAADSGEAHEFCISKGLCVTALRRARAASAEREQTSELAAVGHVGGGPIGFITKLSF